MISRLEVHRSAEPAQFAAVAVEGTRSGTKLRIVPRPVPAVQAIRANQLTITGAQILTACTVVLCLASLSVWMVRYWLFAR